MECEIMPLVAYYRVSTAEQGLSGLGLEAQRAAVHLYAGHVGQVIRAEFQEVQSSRKQRPVFDEALSFCQQFGDTLAVARLDRLSRDLHTITTLQKSGVKFLSVDMPGAEKMVIQMMGVIAEYERDTTSARTKAALAAAKARGVRLGAPDPMKPFTPVIYDRARVAEQFRAELRPVVLEMRLRGLTFQQIADHFNERKTPTASGSGRWLPATVARILKTPSGLNLASQVAANDDDLPLFNAANRL